VIEVVEEESLLALVTYSMVLERQVLPLSLVVMG